MKNGSRFALLGLLAAVGAVGVVSFRDDVPQPNAAPAPAVAPRASHLPSEPSSASSAAPTSARVVGVMVNAPTRGASEHFEELAFFGTTEKTRVAVEIFHGEGGLIDVRREESTIERFSDDRGTDFLDPDDFFGPVEMMPRIAEDGRSAVFVVSSDELPAAGASRITIQGEVSIVVADERAVSDATGIELSVGTTFSVAGFEFEVTESAGSEWSEGWNTTLQLREDPSAIVRWALVDPKTGTETEWNPTMSMSGGDIWQQTLESPTELAGPVTVRIEAWVDPQVVALPLELSTGLSLR